MRKPQGLYRRGAVYYWRRVIPDRHVTGGRPAEIRLSLRTTSYGRAVVRARRLSAATDRQLEAIAENMKADQLSPQHWRTLVRDFIEDELDQMETLRAEQDALASEALDASARTWDMIAEGWREDLASNNLEPVAQLAYAFLTGKGVEVDPASPRFKRFARHPARSVPDRPDQRRAQGRKSDDFSGRCGPVNGIVPASQVDQAPEVPVVLKQSPLFEPVAKFVRLCLGNGKRYR